KQPLTLQVSSFVMIDKSVPFSVRRARLLLGLTRMQLAELYGVDESTVYQWELGSAHPSVEIWARLRSVSLKASSFLDDDLVRVSPPYKFIVDIEELTSPIIASKGIIEALKAVRASKGEDRAFGLSEIARKSPHYQVSGIRALEIVQADPRWR